MQNLDWESWAKPWTREQCKERFIYGDTISIRGMAESSGRGKSTIERWRDDDNWEAERRHYQDTLRTVTQQKVLDKTSEKLSDDLVGIAVDNYEVHKLEREVAHSVLKIKSRLLALIDLNQLDIEEIVEILKKVDGCDTNYWSLMLSRATSGISNSTGLSNFVNVNAAFKRIEQEGFVIIDPGVKAQNQENE